MTGKLVLVLCLFVLFFSLLYARFNLMEVKASNLTGRVHNINTSSNYTNIQEAIDDPLTLDGHAIFVEEGIYYEHVVVHKSLSLTGQNRNNTIIDGNTTGIVILVTANDVSIKGFTVQNGSTGIYVDRSNYSAVMENDVRHNVDAVFVRFSNNCIIYQNLAGNNSQRGILITNSRNSNVSYNDVYGNQWYGINANASVNGLIAQNNVAENVFDGIGLLDSSYYAVTGNNVNHNPAFGILLDYHSRDNFIYHNNLIDNGIQAVDSGSTNQWDNDVEGNYWSNYTGVDSNRDGIGDIPHTIDENTTDDFPLVGMFSGFDTSSGHHVNVISNSTVEDFEYFESNNTIRLHVSNMTTDQTFGFCRIRIPHALMSEPNNVTVDGAEPYYINYTLHDDGDDRWIYFSYQHSTLEIIIVPELLSPIIPSIFMIITLLALIVYKSRIQYK